MKWYEKIGYQLFEPNRDQSPGELIFFKIFELFILIYTIKYAWEWGIYTQLRNSEVVLPLGVANYIDISILFQWNLALINAAVITLLSSIAFTRMGYKWFYMVVMVLLHIQYVARFSQGEIPHSMNLIGMSVLCFAVGAIWFPGKKQMPRFVMGSIIFFIGLGYTSAFIAKMIGKGIYWFDGRHLWLWISEKSIDVYSSLGYYEPNILQELALNYLPLASLILLIGWFTELIGFTMWWKKLRPFTTMLLLGMHIGITLTMNIRFDSFVMQLILIGFPWYLLIDRYIKTTPKWVEKLV
ncbi:hypothetical protein [Rhodohalobacter sp.]|uniref:hypothetical protein n=1 Tax=Rhodohalobacter sp. TaxID=1974210 RepID=UPI002ACEF31F|nr:hypothetical protein [Rhodohalobacter sp.]MDZ7756850.1 hypothetical protein [Rhodohalobacter sp.]